MVVEWTCLHLLMLFSSVLTIIPFVLVVLVALFMGLCILYFFQRFPNFCVQI